MVGLGGIQRSLELGGPQAEQCVTARAWQGLQPWGGGGWEAWEWETEGSREVWNLPEEMT